MSRKTHEPAEIVAMLRQVDAVVSQGRSVTEAVRSLDPAGVPMIVDDVAKRRAQRG
jgi:hypothetical protein